MFSHTPLSRFQSMFGTWTISWTCPVTRKSLFMLDLFPGSHHRRSMSSILLCRFMLSLREFDSTNAAATISVHGSQVREHHRASTVLEFGGQPRRSLSAFIAPFANSIHIGSNLSKMDDNDVVVDGRSERESGVTGLHAEGPIFEALSSESSVPGQSSATECPCSS